MNFKEQLAKDAEVFLNIDEFAVEAEYDGRTFSVTLDFAGMEQRTIVSPDGQSIRALIWVSAQNMVNPQPEEKIMLPITLFGTIVYQYKIREMGYKDDILGYKEDKAQSFWTSHVEPPTKQEWKIGQMIESDGIMHLIECIAYESPWER